jgi:hypothetical protein
MEIVRLVSLLVFGGWDGVGAGAVVVQVQSTKALIQASDTAAA